MPGFHADHDGSITLHTFTESSDAAVDEWADAVARVIESTPPDQVFVMLLDVSAPQVSFTRYARATAQTLFTRYQHRHGRLAYLFSSKIAPYYARIFLASLGKLEFESGYFSRRDQAIRWLHDAERLPK